MVLLLDFKKFSANNRGPRSKEVDQILTSIYSQSSSHNFWRANHILKLSVVSALPQKMLTRLHDGWAVVFNLDMYGTFLDSHSTLNLTITISTHLHLQYTLKLVSKSAHWQITKWYKTRFHSQDRFLKCPVNLSVYPSFHCQRFIHKVFIYFWWNYSAYTLVLVVCHNLNLKFRLQLRG